MQRITRLATTAVAASMTLAAAFAVAPGANAKPTGCTDSYSSKNVYASCSGGTGQVRAVGNCHDRLRDSYTTAYGKWVGPRVTSTATCPVLGGVQTVIENSFFAGLEVR